MMSPISFLCALSSFVGCFVIATASLRAEPPVAADEAVELALSKNPELAAARMVIAEAEARTRTTGRLTNPELTGEVASGQDFEGRVAVGITQPFPLTGRLRFERELSAVELEMARLEIKDRERQLKAAVRKAFYDLVAARAAISLVAQQADLAASFAKVIADGVGQGFGSSLDAQQAQLATEVARAKSVSLRSEEVAALARLNVLIGRPSDTLLRTESTLNLPKTIPANRTMRERADLQLAETAVRGGAAQVSLAKASRWEDLGVGVFVEGERFRDEPEGIEPEALVGLQFNIPLPLWQNGSGKVAEMEAAQARKTATLDALRFSARNEALTAHAILSVRFRSAAEMQATLVPAAKKQVTDAEAAYLRGELDITTVFRTREQLVEVEAASLEARKNYFAAYAEWLAALGETSAQP